jgi:TatA/E family protein of Tat protein translocase
MVLGFVLSPLSWAILVLVIILLFGGKRFVDAARGLGRGAREFKDEIKGPDEPEQKELPPSRAPSERDAL